MRVTAAALLALLLAPAAAGAHHGPPPLPEREVALLDLYDRLHDAAEGSPRVSAGRDVRSAGRPADGRLSWSLLRVEAERLWRALHPAAEEAHDARSVSRETGPPAWWLRLAAPVAACESGGNPAAVSPGGTYRGRWQFDLSTWASVGGSGDPAAASPGEQDARAYRLWQARGWAPWPVCGRLAGG